MEDVLIVGAGLSGLSAAYYLKKAGIDAVIIEARERCSGRIFTVRAECNNTPVEMGATWFAAKHTYLMQLLHELNLPYYKQFQKGIGIFESLPSEPPQLFDIPETEEPSYRIAGGTSVIIDTLIEYIGKEKIILGSPISIVSECGKFIEIGNSQGSKYAGKYAIITIPPFLLVAQKIEFIPGLPEALIKVIRNTHTWMGDAVKFAIEYKRPFWREKGYSGTILSQTGIAQEIYDHTNFEENRFALKGFLSVNASKLLKSERVALLMDQLTRLLGSEAANYLSYTEKVWEEDRYTYRKYEQFVAPHQNNGHMLYEQSLMNGKLYLAGTETSPYFGGYMDGAVYSALHAAKNIIQCINK